MSKLTRKGIAYDFHISPYKTTIIYNEGFEVEYTFSSEFYLNKFKNQFEENRKKINESLSKRFGFSITNNVLSDLVLYRRIEIRGFLIKCNGVPAECPNDITLDGKNPIMRH